MSIYKNGIVSAQNIYEQRGLDLLINSGKYTVTSPYVISGTTGDNYNETDMYCQVTPGKQYYLLGNCSSWSPAHGPKSSTYGKGTLWLYLSETYNPSSFGYKTPVCYNSSNWIRGGMARNNS